MQRNPAHGLQGNKMGRPLAGSSVLIRQAARFVPRFPVLCLVLLMKYLSRDIELMLSATEMPIVAHLYPPSLLLNRSVSIPSADCRAEGYSVYC